MSTLEELMPRVETVMVGLSKPEKHEIGQLSLKKQMEAGKQVKKIYAELIKTARTPGGKGEDAFVNRIFDLVENDLVEFLNKLTGIAKAKIEDATNDQIVGIIEVIYSLNFEKIEKNLQKLTERIQKGRKELLPGSMPPESFSPQ